MDVALIDKKLIRELALERNNCGHKGTFGTALLVAGSKYMSGALVLATSSALRSGVGMVRVFSEDDALLPVKFNCPCAITSPYSLKDSDTLKTLSENLKKSTAVGIGSGINQDLRINSYILENVILNSPHLVIDAGALNIIASNKEHFFVLLQRRKELGLPSAILTPHIGEFQRLSGINLKGYSSSEVIREVTDFSLRTNTLLVLKSSTIYVSDCGNKNYFYEGNNSGMAKGGSGDVLMGLITGLLAQGMDELSASLSGVYFHQAAGIYAKAELGERCMLPEDLSKYFGRVFDETGW